MKGLLGYQSVWIGLSLRPDRPYKAGATASGSTVSRRLVRPAESAQGRDSNKLTGMQISEAVRNPFTDGCPVHYIVMDIRCLVTVTV